MDDVRQKSLDEILSDEPTEAAEQETEQQAEAPEPEAAEQPDEGPVRDEHGRFAKKGENPAPPAEVKDEFDGKATIAERQKRQEAEAQLQQLRAEIEQIKQQQQQPQSKPEVPDMFADPEGWQQYQQAHFNQQLYQRDLQYSERLARMQHGDDTVNAALEWGKQRCNTDRVFNDQVASSGDPVGFAVREYQRDQLVNNVSPEDFAAFREWQQSGGQVQPQQPRRAPPTLATERNAGSRSGPAWAGPKPLSELLP